MNIDRISYQRVFPIGNFATQRIGLEATLDENENPEEALTKLMTITNELHSATIATLEEYRGTTTRTIEESPVNSTIKGIIEDIQACTVVDEKNSLGVQVGLLAYEPVVAQNPELQDTYDQKLKELSHE